MSFLIQASANVPDWDAFRAAVEWLHQMVEPAPPGFVSFKVMRGVDDPSRMTILEEWESKATFDDAFAKYDQTHRGLFLEKAGIDPSAFERAFWEPTGISF